MWVPTICQAGGSEVKASAWNAGDQSSIPGSGRSPGEGKWQPAPVLLPGESHGQSSLVGYIHIMGSQGVVHGQEISLLGVYISPN